jgi:hypothetical protein
MLRGKCGQRGEGAYHGAVTAAGRQGLQRRTGGGLNASEEDTPRRLLRSCKGRAGRLRVGQVIRVKEVARLFKLRSKCV